MSYGLGKSAGDGGALSGYDASAWDAVLDGAAYMRGGAQAPAPQSPVSGMRYNDFTSLFGIIHGESLDGETIFGRAGIADVVANRLVNPGAYAAARNPTIAGVVSARWPGRDNYEFNAYGNARYQAGVRMAARAAVDPAGARAGLYGAEIQRTMAAIDGVFGVAPALRGITRGSDQYMNPAAAQNPGPQREIAARNGSTVVGGHTFTGEGFLPTDEGVRNRAAVGIRTPEHDGYESLSKLGLSTAPSGGAMWQGLTDWDAVAGFSRPDYSDITAGMYPEWDAAKTDYDAVAGFSPTPDPGMGGYSPPSPGAIPLYDEEQGGFHPIGFAPAKDGGEFDGMWGAGFPDRSGAIWGHEATGAPTESFRANNAWEIANAPAPWDAAKTDYDAVAGFSPPSLPPGHDPGVGNKSFSPSHDETSGPFLGGPSIDLPDIFANPLAYGITNSIFGPAPGAAPAQAEAVGLPDMYGDAWQGTFSDHFSRSSAGASNSDFWQTSQTPEARDQAYQDIAPSWGSYAPSAPAQTTSLFDAPGYDLAMAEHRREQAAWDRAVANFGNPATQLTERGQNAAARNPASPMGADLGFGGMIPSGAGAFMPGSFASPALAAAIKAGGGAPPAPQQAAPRSPGPAPSRAAFTSQVKDAAPRPSQDYAPTPSFHDAPSYFSASAASTAPFGGFTSAGGQFVDTDPMKGGSWNHGGGYGYNAPDGSYFAAGGDFIATPSGMMASYTDPKSGNYSPGQLAWEQQAQGIGIPDALTGKAGPSLFGPPAASGGDQGGLGQFGNIIDAIVAAAAAEAFGGGNQGYGGYDPYGGGGGGYSGSNWSGSG